MIDVSAGYYNFIWNGRNTMGAKVATGESFYNALIRNEQGEVVLNKTMKMISLKQSIDSMFLINQHWVYL